MIGIIPSISQTFEVYDDFNAKSPVAGKLYVDPRDGRVYMYSTTETRASPATGYFPVWDGSKCYISQFANSKYLDKDVIRTGIDDMSSKIDKSTADQVLYLQRRSDNAELLKPQITDGDNMFTQCIKGVICAMDLTMVDLVDMSSPKLSEKAIENYYSALTKITFMRLDKWNVWVNVILHIRYTVRVYRGDTQLVSFEYPHNKFTPDTERYQKIIKSSDDPLKKIIKILMDMENITKSTLKGDDIDDYTINNMLTTLSGTKPLSAQLFSRFIRMASLTYSVDIFDNTEKLIFKYKE